MFKCLFVNTNSIWYSRCNGTARSLPIQFRVRLDAAVNEPSMWFYLRRASLPDVISLEQAFNKLKQIVFVKAER